MSYRWRIEDLPLEITASPSSLEELERITADLWRTLLVDYELGMESPSPEVLMVFFWGQAYRN